MYNNFQYRLSKSQKEEIAQNLMDILQKNANISELTTTFVGNWLLTGPEEKRKAFFDVWDIVLKNYLPVETPILFRACQSISNNRISSFTGRIECASRFGNGKGYLLICDTKEQFEFEKKYYTQGNYRHTFFPLVSVLKKVRDSNKSKFSDRIWEFIGEDEYIMRINLGNINILKWVKINT